MQLAHRVSLAHRGYPRRQARYGALARFRRDFAKTAKMAGACKLGLNDRTTVCDSGLQAMDCVVFRWYTPARVGVERAPMAAKITGASLDVGKLLTEAESE